VNAGRLLRLSLSVLCLNLLANAASAFQLGDKRIEVLEAQEK